jgi:hypothetical protein
MVWGDPKRLVAVAAVIVVTLTGAVGCAAASDGPTLADTKSPVQLLRNEAASRIPPAAIGSVTETGDFSMACESESEDPEGLRRSWHSNTQVTVEAASTWRVDAIVDALAESFGDQGWTVTPVAAHDRTHAVTLTREGSASKLRVSAHRPDPESPPLAADEGKPITIDVESNGPCVNTAGGDSDEVKQLEART